MSRKHKVLLTSILVVLVLISTWLLFTMNIRSEFKTHLGNKYPEQKFTVGIVKYDPLYGNYFADVTCLDDSIHFRVGKNSYTKEVSDYYGGMKRTAQSNSEVTALFNQSDIKSSIEKVSGWGISPGGGEFGGISLVLTGDADMASVAVQTIVTLKENKISSQTVDLLQEKDKKVYELRLSPADYALSKSELEAKIKRRK